MKKMMAVVLSFVLVLAAQPLVVEAAGNGGSFPASYSSVSKGYVTSVKNQNPWGACWTFSAAACMESYALSHGYAVNAGGRDGIDISEYALAELTYNDQGFESQTGDYTVMTGSFASCLTGGGNYSLAFKTLNKWAGVYYESQAPYDTNSSDGAAWYDLTGVKPSFYLTGMNLLSLGSIEEVKAAIMENGAVGANCYADSAYQCSGDGYSDYYLYNYEKASFNHAITLVGWDDTIAASKFTVNGHMPSRNGGWLVKNSWGTSYGNGGYQWISYGDVGLLASTGVVYKIVPSSTYDYNYQHDGATQMSGATLNATSFANVFTVPSGVASHQIAAVAFGIHTDYTNYSIQLYRLNSASDNPLSGTPLLSSPVTGSTGREGYYTVKLPAPVTLTSGQSFAVVINFSSNVSIWCSTGNWAVGSYAATVCSRADGQSYYGTSTSLSGYNSSKYNSNICLKAFAIDASQSGGRGGSSQITSSVFSVDQNVRIINGIAAGMTIADFCAQLSDSSSIVVCANNQTLGAGDRIRTGATVLLYSGGVVRASYTAVVPGDVNGDGLVDLSDMLLVKKQAQGRVSLTRAFLAAADANGDGATNIEDYEAVRDSVMER